MSAAVTPARKRNRPGRKSNLERLEIQAREQKVARTLEQEAKRARPLLADTRLSLMVAVGLVALLMASSFAVSFAGIYAVSAFTGLPSYLQWLPALFVDMAILAYTLSLLIFKSRGQSTWRTMLGLMGFASLSVGINVIHTLDFWGGSISDYRGWVGIIITAAAPIAVLLASEELGRLAFAQPEGTN